MVNIAPAMPLVPGRATFNVWSIAVFVLVAIYLGPIFAVFAAAAGDSGGLWTHLFETVLARYVANTLILMTGVGLISLVFGVSTAWIITRYDFPFRKVLEWMLLLPAAVPAYLIAYTYTDFLEYAGPVQSALRGLFGWESARDYWFPEIRSMGGAMLVMGAVLYPYVYMMTRTALLLTPASLFETGLLTNSNLFTKIALPLARPAIAAGLALVLMETISDFGTVEYFAVETLTLGIFNVWLGMNSLPAAAQISCLAFLFIIVLLLVEMSARKKRRYMDTSRRAVQLRPCKVSGRKAGQCIALCLVPVLLGFFVPAGVLMSFVLRGYSVQLTDAVVSAGVNTLLLASVVAALVMAAASFMVLSTTYRTGITMRRLVRVASIGYAFPGTILAIGVVTAAGWFDGAIVFVAKGMFGVTTTGWLTAGLGLVVLACAIRFQAVGYGAIVSGVERLPPNMMNASRVLGRTFGESLRAVVMPLIRAPFLAGGVLVFIDVMKELPMTLLLRPFNYETLATYVYQFAKDELLEEAALPALFIIAVGLIPVIVMNAALRKVARPAA